MNNTTRESRKVSFDSEELQYDLNEWRMYYNNEGIIQSP